VGGYFLNMGSGVEVAAPALAVAIIAPIGIVRVRVLSGT
jgi:hypothetical protein